MPVADIILVNAGVITMDEKNPSAGMVAIKGNKILFAGEKESGSDFIGTETRVIDCSGMTVLPGFNDAHIHLFSFIRKLMSLDLSPEKVKCIADIKALIKHHVEITSLGSWISGTDFSDFYLAERRYPSRWELDEVAPVHPVVLSHAGLHTCVLNSLALRLARIDKKTPAPKGTLIEKDETGEPTGVLHEMLGYIREKVMPPFTKAELEKGMKLASEHFVSQGITSVQDATVVNDIKRWQLLKRIKDGNKFIPRIYMMFGPEHLDDFYDLGLSFFSGDSDLRLGGMKILVTERTGKVYPEQRALNKEVKHAARAGFPVAIHAAQSKCVDRAATALEYVRVKVPEFKLRQRIEHCSICLPGSLEKLKKTKPVIAVQPAFIHYGGDRYLARATDEEKPFIYPYRSLLNAGLMLAASTDSPIVPDTPMITIQAALTRKTKNGSVILPQEALTVEEVLRMYAVNAAYASSEENMKGTISPGKLADLVVLDRNPLTTPAEEIRDIKVRMTIAGGRVVFEA